MSGDLKNLIPTVEVDRDGCVVTIDLNCSDELAACVLFDDIVEKITSGQGLRLSIRGMVSSKEEAAK